MKVRLHLASLVLSLLAFAAAAGFDVCRLHERVFRFGFGVKARRKVPFAKLRLHFKRYGW